MGFDFGPPQLELSDGRPTTPHPNHCYLSKAHPIANLAALAGKRGESIVSFERILSVPHSLLSACASERSKQKRWENSPSPEPRGEGFSSTGMGWVAWHQNRSIAWRI